MAVETPEDRLTFLNPDEFGVEALYTPVDGAPKTIAGIFDNGHYYYDPNRLPGSPYQLLQGAGISTTDPEFRCRTADLVGGGSQGDLLDLTEIDGKVYRVNDARPDGTGMTVLALMEVD